MIPLVACAEAARLDAATASGAAVPPLLLMEDASLGLWAAIEPIARERGAGSSALMLALCGSGNNGGDALALLRHARFRGRARVAAILAKEPGDLAAVHASSLKALGVEVRNWSQEREACLGLLGEASLILDGLAGSGLSGPLREPLVSLLAAANEAAEGRAAIASIDLPSGLSDSYEAAWPIARASWTLSVEPRKSCLYYPAARSSCGEIVPVFGVFPSDAVIEHRAELLEEGDLPSLAPRPDAAAFKGTRGRVAVFAGSIGASGAAVLSSRACLAAGAGLVSLYASDELYPVVAPMLDAVMVKPEPGDLSSFGSGRCDVLLVGPGWGKGPTRKEQLEALLDKGVPAVLDADAIHLYRELVDSGFAPRAPVILTPHPGEFAALTGIEAERALASPASCVSKAAVELDAVIALKSHVTWIASPAGELAVWDGMESGLGTAGSGDVLAGLIAGILARRSARASAASGGAFESGLPDAYSAARAGVIAHGSAGRRARALRGWFEAAAIAEEAAKLLGRS